MQLAIPLDTMTIEEKLRALEEIWSDLQRTPEDVPSPAWHGDVLHERESAVRDGRANFSDWTDAKRRIRKQIR